MTNSSRSPGISKKDYNILGDNSQDQIGGSEEKQEGVHVRWKNGIKDDDNNGGSVRENDKGHSRSTSLDLNKMLLAGSNSDGETHKYIFCMFVMIITVCEIAQCLSPLCCEHSI